jgi:hypothetical protein
LPVQLTTVLLYNAARGAPSKPLDALLALGCARRARTR